MTLPSSIPKHTHTHTQGLKGTDKMACIEQYVEGMIGFAINFGSTAPAEESVPGDLLKCAIGMIGDVGDAYGAKYKHVLHCPEVHRLIQAGERSTDEDVKGTTGWAKEVLHALA